MIFYNSIGFNFNGLLFFDGIVLLLVALIAWSQPRPHQSLSQRPELVPGFTKGLNRFYALVYEQLLMQESGEYPSGTHPLAGSLPIKAVSSPANGADSKVGTTSISDLEEAL